MNTTPHELTNRVAVVMTVFNRREHTLRCLESLTGQESSSAELTIFVVDDASTDGTSEAIANQFPGVRLIRGTGDLYWNGGMHVGLEAALGEGFDFYWWLNDDVELDRDALARLLRTAHRLSDRDGWPGIVVGSMRDPDDGHLTYGGVVRTSALRRFNFTLVEPTDEPLRVETMNGNCVIVPKAVAHNLGNLSSSYRQKMGDYDYGLRARQAGYGVWVAPGTYGDCARHPERRTDLAPLVDELNRLWSVKELPFRPWWAFTRRWGGILWPIYFISPYVRRGANLIAERARRR